MCSLWYNFHVILSDQLVSFIACTRFFKFNFIIEKSQTEFVFLVKKNKILYVFVASTYTIFLQTQQIKKKKLLSRYFRWCIWIAFLFWYILWSCWWWRSVFRFVQLQRIICWKLTYTIFVSWLRVYMYAFTDFILCGLMSFIDWRFIPIDERKHARKWA